MKALKRMTKEELIQELTNTRKQLKRTREALDNEAKLRRSDQDTALYHVERTRSAMKDKLDTASCQYREWKALAEKYQSEFVEVQRDRDFFRRVLEKMSR